MNKEKSHSLITNSIIVPVFNIKFLLLNTVAPHSHSLEVGIGVKWIQMGLEDLKAQFVLVLEGRGTLLELAYCIL